MLTQKIQKRQGQTGPERSNAPKKPRDHRFVPEGVDWATANPGVEDKTKFLIRVPTEMPNPNIPGEFIPAPDIDYWYKNGQEEILDAFDFNDPEDIHRLHVWRHQLRYRTCPPTRKERPFVSRSFLIFDFHCEDFTEWILAFRI